jgi:hypothetical protein
VKGDDILQRFDQLKVARSPFDSSFQKIAEYVRPIRADFDTQRTAGERRDRKIYDSTPARALQNLTAGVYGMFTNPANEWIGVHAQDNELDEYQPHREYLEGLTTLLLDSMAPSQSRFYSQIKSFYADWGGFGNGAFWVEDDARGRLIDTCIPFHECYWAENDLGEVDTMARLTRWTARQIVQKYGEENTPADIKAEAKVGSTARHDLVQWVAPNPDYQGGPAFIPERKPFASVHVLRRTGHILKRGGYDEQPGYAARWEVAAGEVYGRSQLDLMLADIMMLQEMNRTTIISAQRQAQPPILAHREDKFRPFQMYPDGVTYGAMTDDGKPLAMPFQSGARLEITLEMLNQRRDAIQSAMFFNLLQLVQQPNVTATQTLEIQEEKMRLLAPVLGELETFLSKVMSRRFNLLWRANKIPPPPEALAESGLKVKFTSPLARAQKTADASAVTRVMATILPYASVDPTALDVFKGDELARTLANGFGVPAKATRSPEEVEQLREQRAQAAQAAQMASMMKPGADAMKSVAQAGQIITEQRPAA